MLEGALPTRLRSILFDPFTFLPSQVVLRLRSHLNPSKAVLQRNYCSTLHDMVVEESSSARSRARMDMLTTVNPSGRKGGYLYRDMYNEVGIDIYLKFSALGHNCRFLYGS